MRLLKKPCPRAVGIPALRLPPPHVCYIQMKHHQTNRRRGAGSRSIVPRLHGDVNLEVGSLRAFADCAWKQSAWDGAGLQFSLLRTPGPPGAASLVEMQVCRITLHQSLQKNHCESVRNPLMISFQMGQKAASLPSRWLLSRDATILGSRTRPRSYWPWLCSPEIQAKVGAGWHGVEHDDSLGPGATRKGKPA